MNNKNEEPPQGATHNQIGIPELIVRNPGGFRGYTPPGII
jgi:hypothetical protein